MSDSSKVEPKKYPKGNYFLDIPLEEDYNAFDNGRTFDELTKIFKEVDDLFSKLGESFNIKPQDDNFDLNPPLQTLSASDAEQLNKSTINIQRQESVAKTYKQLMDESWIYRNPEIKINSYSDPLTSPITGLSPLNSYPKNYNIQKEGIEIIEHNKYDIIKNGIDNFAQFFSWLIKSHDPNEEVKKQQIELEKQKEFRNIFIKKIKNRKQFEHEKKENELKTEEEFKENNLKRHEIETDINSYPLCVRRFAGITPLSTKALFEYNRSLDMYYIRGTGDLKDIIFLPSAEFRDRYYNPTTRQFNWKQLGIDMRSRTALSTGNFTTNEDIAALSQFNAATVAAEGDEGLITTNFSTSYQLYDGWYINTKNDWTPGRYICNQALPLSTTINLEEIVIKASDKDQKIKVDMLENVFLGNPLSQNSDPNNTFSNDKNLKNLTDLYNFVFVETEEYKKTLTQSDILKILTHLYIQKDNPKWQKGTVNSLQRISSRTSAGFRNSLVNDLPPSQQEEIYNSENPKTEAQIWAYVASNLENDSTYRDKVINNLVRPNQDFVDLEAINWYKNNTPDDFFNNVILRKNKDQTIPDAYAPPTIDFITGPGYTENDRTSYDTDKANFIKDAKAIFVYDEEGRPLSTMGKPYYDNEFTTQYDELRKKSATEQNAITTYSMRIDELKYYIFHKCFGNIGIGLSNLDNKFYLNNDNDLKKLKNKDIELINYAINKAKIEFYIIVIKKHKYYLSQHFKEPIMDRFKGDYVYEFALQYGSSIAKYGSYIEAAGVIAQIVGLGAELYFTARQRLRVANIGKNLKEIGKVTAIVGRIAAIAGYGLEAYKNITNNPGSSIVQITQFIFFVLLAKGQYAFKGKLGELVKKKITDWFKYINISTAAGEGGKALALKLFDKTGEEVGHNYVKGKFPLGVALTVLFHTSKATGRINVLKTIGASALATGVSNVGSLASYYYTKNASVEIMQKLVDNLSNVDRAFLESYVEITTSQEFNEALTGFLQDEVDDNGWKDIIRQTGYTEKDLNSIIDLTERFEQQWINLSSGELADPGTITDLNNNFDQKYGSLKYKDKYIIPTYLRKTE